MADEEEKDETIVIRIDKENVTYETDLPFSEVIMWLEILKTMMINGVIE